jgi:hypothetical protein
VFTVLAALSGMEREYIRDRTLEGHESARSRGKTIGGAAVTDDAMLSMALHLREQNLSLRDIPARLVITKGKEGRHPSAATVLRMPREHDGDAAPASTTGWPSSRAVVPAAVPTAYIDVSAGQADVLDVRRMLRQGRTVACTDPWGRGPRGLLLRALRLRGLRVPQQPWHS